mgnify:CR=1 FL=1
MTEIKYEYTFNTNEIYIIANVSVVMGGDPSTYCPAQRSDGPVFSWCTEEGDCGKYMEIVVRFKQKTIEHSSNMSRKDRLVLAGIAYYADWKVIED